MMDEEIVDSSPRQAMLVPTRGPQVSLQIKAYLALIGLVIVGVALWKVWDQLVYLGYFLIFVIGLSALLGVTALFFKVQRLRKPVKVINIGDKGVVLVDEMSGRMTTIAPQAPATKPNREPGSLKPATVKAVVPKLSDLLSAQILRPGMPAMLIGIRENITPRWGSLEEDVKCAGIGGRGRSGKTNTMFFYVVQYLFQFAEIWLADPHFNKASGLTNMLGPLRKYIRIAGTLDEIQRMFDDLQVEIEEHKADPGPHRPFVIICDEWNGILEDFDIEAEQQGLKEKDSYSRVAAALIVKVEREMAGYNMYAALGVHDWMDKALGGTALRRLIHSVLCHRMTADYSKHILEDKVWNSQTQGLRTGHCVFRDNEGVYERLIMPFCQKEDAFTVARMLETIVEAEEPHQEAISAPNTPTLPPLSPRPQIGPARSETQPRGDERADEVARNLGKTGPLNMSAEAAIQRVQRPTVQPLTLSNLDEEEETTEADLADREDAPEVTLTAAEETEFLAAALQLHQELGKKPGRVAIMQRARTNALKSGNQEAAIKWNKKNWARIMALGKKFGL